MTDMQTTRESYPARRQHWTINFVSSSSCGRRAWIDRGAAQRIGEGTSPRTRVAFR